MSVKSVPESKVLKNDLILGCQFEAGLEADWARGVSVCVMVLEGKPSPTFDGRGARESFGG